MSIRGMKKPGGGGNDADVQVLEIGREKAPDVTEQLEKLGAAAKQASRDKDSLRAEKRQREREREERFRCCGIRP